MIKWPLSPLMMMNLPVVVLSIHTDSPSSDQCFGPPREDGSTLTGYLTTPLTDKLPEQLQKLREGFEAATVNHDGLDDIFVPFEESCTYYQLAGPLGPTQHQQEQNSSFIRQLKKLAARPGILIADRRQLPELVAVEMNTGVGRMVTLDRVHGYPACRVPLGGRWDQSRTPPLGPAVQTATRIAAVDESRMARVELQILAQQHPREALRLIEEGLPVIQPDGRVQNRVEGIRAQAATTLLQHTDQQIRQQAIRALKGSSAPPTR